MSPAWLAYAELTVHDEQAIAEWARSALPRAVAYAQALLSGPGRASQAEDVVQDVLCRLLARRGHYDLPADGDRLLFRSVTNACINATVRRRELASLDGQLPGTGLPLGETVAGDPAERPDQQAMTAELAQRVGAAISRLAPIQRAVISLRALGQTPGQIAQALDLSPGHVAVLTHRARAALAESLADVLD